MGCQSTVWQSDRRVLVESPVILSDHTRMKTSYEFSDAIVRIPGASVVDGLSQYQEASSVATPDPDQFVQQHQVYIETLRRAGLEVQILESAEEYPDSVFVEDAALCIGDIAIVLRPGAASRAGEAALIKPVLEQSFQQIHELPDEARLDGGDVLVTEDILFVGLSERTDRAGISALESLVEQYGYSVRTVDTPSSILHFKTACGLLDDQTIFATETLADTGCFDGLQVIKAVEGEEAAANLVRINEFVLLKSGAPATRDVLENAGYRVTEVDVSEPAKIDGGLSCMSLRYQRNYAVSSRLTQG